MEYGLIGKTLGHSFSKIVHEAITDYGYELYPLPTEEEFHDFMKAKNFRGINVTIPYKQDVIPYCDVIDEKAKAIGAVNTIVNHNGKLHGYNTDFDGFLFLCQRAGISFENKVVLILGTGGTYKTVQSVATAQKAKQILVASRRSGPGLHSYEEVQQSPIAETVEIIINTSPVGMFPHNQEQAISLAPFPNLTGVVDVVYNPLCTLLIQAARERQIPSCGGLPMLVAQAKYAAEHFKGASIPEEANEKVLAQIGQKQSNLVLIGMPSSGKSTLGKKCAKNLGREFVDLDEEIKKKAQKTIPEIFAEDGEEAFRKLETEVCWEFGKENNLVLSSGGGMVTRKENLTALGQNGIFIYVKRDLEVLDIGKNRPLSQSKEDVQCLYYQRTPIYEKAAHGAVENNQAVHLVAKDIQEAFHEVFSHQWP
ncbi:MAG: shikimate kinase [Eubacteriales bacterium]